MDTAAATISQNRQSAGQPDLKALKVRQQAAWSSGDYALIGTTLQIVGEELCEALDLRSGQKVLDVAAGNGNASLAAARRWCDVVATDYVPALLERARERAAAERLDIEFREADAEALPFPDGSFDVVVSTFGVMFTPDQERAAAEMVRVCKRGGKIGLANWTPEGFIGQLFKTIGKHVPPAAWRQVAGALGHPGADRRAVRAARDVGQFGETKLRVSLSLAGALAGSLQDLLRPGAQDLRRARTRGAGGAPARSHGVDRSVQPLGGRHDGRAQRVPRDRDHAALSSACIRSEPFFREAGAGPGVVCTPFEREHLGAMARADGSSGAEVPRPRSRFV